MNKYLIVSIVVIAAMILVVSTLVYSIAQDNGKAPGKSTQQTIAGLFSQKYSRPTDKFIIKIESETGTFAKGTMNFTDEPGGGVWFAAKTDNGWELAFDGNGIVTCDAASKYNFPKDMVPQCIDVQNGNKLIGR